MVGSVRDEKCPVMISRRETFGPRSRIHARAAKCLGHAAVGAPPPADRPWREYPRVGPVSEALVADDKPVDFLRGAAEMVAALGAGRQCRLSSELGVHMVELTERLRSLPSDSARPPSPPRAPRLNHCDPAAVLFDRHSHPESRRAA